MAMAANPSFATVDLRRFATSLFRNAGLDAQKAAVVGDLLLAADVMGHTTHGLALAARYLQEITDGSMAVDGSPEVVSDRGPCVSWNGRRLPGVWLTALAVDLALERVSAYGTVTVVIGNSHHIGCLAVFLPKATDAGYMAIIASSDPSQRSVAPFGGTKPLFTPNPFAIGIPTDRDPIFVDVSASITTNNMAARLKREGRKFPGLWAMDGIGQPSDDPSVLDTAGSILPAGGLDHGQKGYGWAIAVEAMTQGLAGFGRANSPKGWGACVFVQVIDPSAFGGRSAFTRQTGFLRSSCSENPPRPGFDRVRLPGERALANRQAASIDGVALYPGILDSLRPWAERLGVSLPTPRESSSSESTTDR
jgi:LDH2 family malate/lactate/ureidoglycolate dehydrogenase